MKKLTLTTNQLKLNKNKISSLSEIQILGGMAGTVSGSGCPSVKDCPDAVNGNATNDNKCDDTNARVSGGYSCHSCYPVCR